MKKSFVDFHFHSGAQRHLCFVRDVCESVCARYSLSKNCMCETRQGLCVWESFEKDVCARERERDRGRLCVPDKVCQV